MTTRAKIYVPYATASSGANARDEVTKILSRFGCESVGFMDDFADHAVILAFKHRGRPVQLRASAKGWAALYLKANPYSGHRRTSRAEWERAALDQGLVAVNSILRDWIKGQITAVETGIMSFEAVFFAHMLTGDGRSVLEVATQEKLLPAPRPEAATPA
jgi:hypothetical protein